MNASFKHRNISPIQIAAESQFFLAKIHFNSDGFEDFAE